MKIIRRLHFETIIRIQREKRFCLYSQRHREGYKKAVLIGLFAFGLLNTRAEVGDRYADSVKKHGPPVAKMVMKDHTIYLFQGNGSTMREVYNLDGRCIESDFSTTEPGNPKLFQAKSTTSSTPATALKSGIDPSATFSREVKILSISLLGFAVAVLLIVIIKKRDRPTPPVTLSKVEEGKSIYQKEEKAITPLLNPCHKEAAFRLSRNEMSLFKALNEAAGEDYIVTYHISFDRIIDILAPRFSDYLSTYRNLKPLFVDFVLHNPDDTSVAAVILLKDTHLGHGYQRKRHAFISEIMIKNRMPLLEIPEKHKYDPEKLREIIAEANQQHSSLASESHPFSRSTSTVSVGS